MMTGDVGALEMISAELEIGALGLVQCGPTCQWTCFPSLTCSVTDPGVRPSESETW
jgi:hypothetical protein